MRTDIDQSGLRQLQIRSGGGSGIHPYNKTTGSRSDAYSVTSHFCRRYPPRSDMARMKAEFPMVRPEQWCGEWDAAPPKQVPVTKADYVTGGTSGWKF